MRHSNLKIRRSSIGRAVRRHGCCLLRLILFSCLLFSFTGCGSLGHKLTFLRPAIGPNDEYVKSLQAKYKDPQAVENFYRGAGSSPSKSRRNQIVNELLFLINDYYSAYELSWYATATGHSFLSDLTTLGLDTATAAVGGAELKTMLAAISTGVGGQKIAVQRDFFQNQNIALIIKNMRAARADVLVKIRAKTPKSTDEYPLEDALLDLQEYFAAGTVIGGIQHADDTAALQKIIAEDAASQNARVDKLAALRTAQDKPKNSPSPKPQQTSTEEQP